MLTLPSDEKSTMTTGDCGAKEQTMTIKWHGGNDSLSLHFVMNETSKNYYMHHLEVNLTSDEFPDGKSSKININNDCKHAMTLNLSVFLITDPYLFPFVLYLVRRDNGARSRG